MLAPALPLEDYALLEDAECEARIEAAKRELGRRCVILGHHYQRDEVFRHADLTGDSLKLSREAARSDAEYIVFCGVHFMAEVADILSRPEQIAILPDLAAGCSMADMANLAAVERGWRELSGIIDPDASVTPVTYINSAADLKAFCGRHGGIVCTSSNAQKILEWSFARRQKVLFFPDQHLGRNTAFAMGFAGTDMRVWDPRRELGGLTDTDCKDATFLLWKGHCSVHQRFRPEHVQAFRDANPDGIVVVHPECAHEVCELADQVGSTDFIIRAVEAAPAGAVIGVGTEIHLVNRLDNETPDKTVVSLDPIVCPCSTMSRIDPTHLAWVLDGLVEGKVRNRITVDERTAHWARVALDRMLQIT